MTHILLRISDFQFLGLIALFAIVAIPLLYVFQRAAGIKGDLSDWLSEEDLEAHKVYCRAKSINRIRKRRLKSLQSFESRKSRQSG